MTKVAGSTICERVGKTLVLKVFCQLTKGRMTLIDGNDRWTFGATDNFDPDLTQSDSGPAVTVRVKDQRFYSSIAFGGSVGASDAYIAGHWSCDDLTGVIKLFVLNRDVLDNMDSGVSRLSSPIKRALHWLNRNTRRGSRRNIAAHYDLGNEFFKLWLDESMMYSSAVFEQAEMELADAALAKLDRICRKLELSPEDHVVEIGTGWGGFAIYAASNFGCRVTTTTISKEQYEFARARVEAAGLSDRIAVLLKDYRDLNGKYDKLVSIEMIEAVGHHYLDTYFRVCSDLLKENGMMLLQAITITDQRYKQALKSVDFIQHYIFPGGFIPSMTAILRSVTASGNMRVYHLEDIGAHYAKTLKCWRSGFVRNLSRIRSMGYDEEFVRMWQFYLCYCEGGFAERALGCAQVLFVKPESRRVPLVPALPNSTPANMTRSTETLLPG